MILNKKFVIFSILITFFFVYIFSIPIIFINLFESNFDIQVLTIAFYQNLNSLLSSLTNELIIYLFFVLNNNLINLIIETDVNKNLNEINQSNKNDFYNTSITFIKNTYKNILN